MPNNLPSSESLAAIAAGAATAECADIKYATAKAIEAFQGGEFEEADQVASWFSLQWVKQPKLWTQADPALDDEYRETMAEAFANKSPDARAKLLKAIGADAADTAAKAWGLTSLNDYKSAPVRPTAETVTAKKKGATNPWSPNYQGDRTAAITAWIRKFGSASASRMASVHNVDLAGRPIARRA